MSDSDAELSNKIVAAYNKIHSTEVWAPETINSVLQQIEYYHVAGIFASKKDSACLCDAFEQLISHLEKQAEMGKKFSYGNMPDKEAGNYLLYNNELFTGNNSVLVDFGDIKITYLNHSSINFISTRDSVLNEYQLSAAQNMINKSEPLHLQNEKGRNSFFNRLRAKIELTRRKIA